MASKQWFSTGRYRALVSDKELLSGGELILGSSGAVNFFRVIGGTDGEQD